MSLEDQFPEDFEDKLKSWAERIGKDKAEKSTKASLIREAIGFFLKYPFVIIKGVAIVSAIAHIWPDGPDDKADADEMEELILSDPSAGAVIGLIKKTVL